MVTKLAAFLVERTDPILAEANQSVSRRHLPHYEHVGAAVTSERLQVLFSLLVRCAEDRHLTPMLEHLVKTAEERHSVGVDLAEVLSAINVLEEAVWHAVLTGLPADEQGEALGLVSTILGAGKDKLACAYVSLASKTPTRSLNLAGLFQGPGEGEVTT